jgi:DNA replication protein DnaC
MATPLEELLKNPNQQELSLREVLDSFSHIELTEDELNVAIIEAKRKKEAILKRQEMEQRAEENRKMLTSKHWSFDQTRKYMLYRAEKLFEGKFRLDEFNEPVFNLLCHYFSYEKEFESLAALMGINNPSLSKGILLGGNFGRGKTWLTSLFRKNNRQVYHIEHAKDVAKSYHIAGEEAIQKYYNKVKNAFNDPTVLFQEYSGLCMEDIGAEDIKNNYGNKTNVIGDILEARYVNECMGVWFHGTTNLTAAQFDQFYGGRVSSRMRENVNFIELGGPDRRK